MSVVVLALLSAMTLGACGSPAPGPNVLFILIDTLRADRLGCYGNDSGLTPFMDRFASSATVFRNAYAASSWTAPSVASLFTSRYLSQHGVVSVVTKLNASELTLPEVLSQHGYHAGAVVANDVVSARIGYDQGFESFRNVAPNAAPVLAQGLEWLDDVRAHQAASPILLYLHFMDPHWPYTPPQEYVDRFVQPNLDAGAELRTMSQKVNLAFTEQYVTGGTAVHRQFTCDEIHLLESLYNAEVAALDAQLERLFAQLEQRRFLDNTVVIVTSDHGEEFFEHGGLWHAYTLYEESIRVPLMIRLPGQVRGRVVDETVSLLDVAPSLVRLLGIEAPPSFEGTSFANLLGGSWWPAPVDTVRRWVKPVPLVAELEGESPLQPQLRAHSGAIIEHRQKLLVRSHGEPELYDLSRDPQEENDLGATQAETKAEMLAQLREVQQAVAHTTASHEVVALDDATQERLKALGYGLADGAERAPADTPREAHPQDVRLLTRREVCEPHAPEPTPVMPSAIENDGGNRPFF